MTTSAADRRTKTDEANDGDTTIDAAKAAADAAALQAAAHDTMETAMALEASTGAGTVTVTFSSAGLGVAHADLLTAATAEKLVWEALGYTVGVVDDEANEIEVQATW